MKKVLTGLTTAIAVLVFAQIASACTAGMVMSQSQMKNQTDEYALIRDVIISEVVPGEGWVNTEAIEAATGTVLYEINKYKTDYRYYPELVPATETYTDIVKFLSKGSRTSLHNLPDEYLTNGETSIYGFPIRTHDMYNDRETGLPKDTPYVNLGSVGSHLIWHGREWENGWGAQDGDLSVSDPWWTDEPASTPMDEEEILPTDHAG
jgi:hypothetical protein